MPLWSRLVRVSPPTTTVVSLDEVKAHLNIDYDDEDEFVLPGIIAAAEAYVEGPNGIGIVLLEQTWRLSLDRFTCPITVPLGPVSDVISITYTDAAGETHTVDPARYVFDVDSQPLKIVPNGSWPSASLARTGAVKVTFTAGYDDPSEVPADLRAAILLLIGHLDRQREAASDRPLSDIPFGVSTIFDRYRVLGIS